MTWQDDNERLRGYAIAEFVMDIHTATRYICTVVMAALFCLSAKNVTRKHTEPPAVFHWITPSEK
jgi:hypothetical protein